MQLSCRPEHEIGKWSGRRGSNPRHAAWKAAALPAELLPLGLVRLPLISVREADFSDGQIVSHVPIVAETSQAATGLTIDAAIRSLPAQPSSGQQEPCSDEDLLRGLGPVQPVPRRAGHASDPAGDPAGARRPRRECRDRAGYGAPAAGLPVRQQDRPGARSLPAASPGSSSRETDATLALPPGASSPTAACCRGCGAAATHYEAGMKGIIDLTR